MHSLRCTVCYRSKKKSERALLCCLWSHLCRTGSLRRSQPRHIWCSRTQSVITVIDKLKVQLGLIATLTNPSGSSSHLLFFPVLQRDSDVAHHFHSPSHSQLLVEPKPSCPRSCSAVWMTRRCSERHWTAQCGGAPLKSSRFFSLSSALCKSPATPSVTSLLPCAPTPVTSFHSGSLSCSPFHASRLCREEMLLSHNSLMAWSVLSAWRRLRVVMYSDKYCQGFSLDAIPWPYGPGNMRPRGKCQD